MPAPRKTPANKPAAKRAPAKPKVVEEASGAITTDQLIPSVGETLDISAAAPVETFESAEVAALKARLAEAEAALEKAHTNPTDSTGKPLPEAVLTPEQKRIRQLEDEAARAKGRNIEEAEEVFDDDATILIHILEDGFTFLGRTWYRGQEVSFGEKAYEETKDRHGNSWLQLDDEGQFLRWGRINFRRGPWPGQRKYAETGDTVSTKAPITVF